MGSAHSGFATTFRRWLGMMGLLIAVSLLLCGPGLTQTEPASETPSNAVYVLTINDGIISPITGEYIEQGIQAAEQANARAVLIQLDTPGGLLASTHQIVKTLMNSPIPVIVYVSPAGARAGSAGVFITMAAHVAAMHPASHIGAAHPVDVGGRWQPGTEEESGEDIEKQPDAGAVMSQKILNDTVSSIRVIARARHRNEEWAVKAVTESASITAEEALEKKVIDVTATGVTELLEKIDGRTVSVDGQPVTLQVAQAALMPYEFSVRQEILSFLTHPILAYFLLMIGFYAILFEVTHPGVGVSGVIGVIALALALTGMQALSINMAGLALIVMGLICFGLEVFFPTAVLAVGGIICVVTGALLLYQTGEPYLMKLVPYLVGTAILLALGTAFILSKVIKAQLRPVSDPKGKLVGETGRVVAPIMPDAPGKVKVFGETWDAQADEPLEKDARIRVIGLSAVDDRVLVVAPLEEETFPSNDMNKET